MSDENIYDVVYTNSDDHKEGEGFNNNNINPKKNRKRGNGFGKTIAMVLTCSLLGGVVGSGVTYYSVGNKTTANNTKTIVADPVSFSDSDSQALSITAAYNKVAPAVVIVSTVTTSTNYFMQQIEAEGMGSGFIINEDGYILTNYHVIEKANKITVTLSTGETVNAEIVNYDENQDIAMIRITDEGVKMPAVAELGDSDALQVGEEVMAIGTPLSETLSHTATKGIVSALNREVQISENLSLNLIQTDAAINNGNSGGPLINTKGQVIGINQSKLSSSTSSSSASVEGIGFAIPINDIKDKIESLSKPILNLGITGRTITKDMASQLNMEQGVYIVDVNEFSPAEKAGLRSGDLIISVDGNRVTDFDTLKEAKSGKNEGDQIEIEYIRDGKTNKTTLTLSSSTNTSSETTTSAN